MGYKCGSQPSPTRPGIDDVFPHTGFKTTLDLGSAQDRHGTPPDGSGNGTDGTQGVVQLRLTLFLFNNGGGATALLAAATLATLDDTAFLARAVLAGHGRSNGQRGDSESGKSLVLHGEGVSDEEREEGSGAVFIVKMGSIAYVPLSNSFGK